MTMGDGEGRLLFQFVRFWSRRWSGAGSGVDADRGRDVMVTEAVFARAAYAGATVNAVADELGIDQSGASRMVGQAVERGYLVKGPGSDARKRVVTVTEAGMKLLAQAHAWQDATFAVLTADWTAEEVESFGVLMRRLIANRSFGR